MFIPLSQCTYTPYELVEDSTQGTSIMVSGEPEVITLIFFERIPDLELAEYWILLTFIVPLMFLMPFEQRRNRFLLVQSMQTAYFLWLAYFVFYAVYGNGFYEPLYGGYLLAVLAGTFGALTGVEWFKYFKKISKR